MTSSALTVPQLIIHVNIKTGVVVPEGQNEGSDSTELAEVLARRAHPNRARASGLRRAPVVERASLARPTLSGVHYRAVATADKLLVLEKWGRGGFDFADRCQSWVSVPKGQQD